MISYWAFQYENLITKHVIGRLEVITLYSYIYITQSFVTIEMKLYRRLVNQGAFITHLT